MVLIINSLNIVMMKNEQSPTTHRSEEWRKMTWRFTALMIVLLMSAVAINNRVVSGTSTTVASGDDGYVIVHTGAAATYTLDGVSDGFSCKIVNHGTGSITFSGAITTASGQTITVLRMSNGEITPGQIGNQITIAKIAGVWRSI